MLFLALLFPWIALAQGGGKGQGSGNPSPSGQGQAPSGGGLPGLSWAQASWGDELMRFPQTLPNTRLLCFKLVYTYDSAQPFVLQRIVPPYSLRGQQCDIVDEKTPLMMRERLVIGIDASSVADLTRLSLLNLNLTNQAGNSINPTPIRPSFAGGAPSAGPTTAAVPRGPFFLAWPDRLPGDVIPTISVSTIYTPPTPGAPWQPNTAYPVGSVVVPTKRNGHYYTALVAGLSSAEPTWKIGSAAALSEKGAPVLTWRDETPLPSPTECGSSVKSWQAGTQYGVGSCVLSKDAHFWVTTVAGKSGNGIEPFPSSSSPGDVFTESATKLKWIDKTPRPPECSSATAWVAHGNYPAGKCIVSKTGRLWVSSGNAASASADYPFPPTSSVGNTINEANGLQWTDRTPPLSAPSQCGSSPKSWQANSIYVAGSCVASLNARLWVVTVAGVSGVGVEPFPAASSAGDSLSEQTVLTWLDSGSSPPSTPAKQWLSGAAHVVGDVVVDPSSGHYYTAIQGGNSCSGNSPSFPVTQIEPFDEAGLPNTVADNNITWAFVGKYLPSRNHDTVYPPGAAVIAANRHIYVATQSGLAKSASTKDLLLKGDAVTDGTVTWKDMGTDPVTIAWKPNTEYWQKAIVYSINKAQFYRVDSAGKGISANATEEPDFPESDTFPRIKWQDSGATAPSVVASGQPADQTLGLLNLTIPQTHSISIFNLSAGVVYNSIRTPSFSVSNGSTVQTGTAPIVDPVLMFTAYVFHHWVPLDAESDWRPRDLVPGLSFGLSLSSPANNFYVGGSSEFFLRNVQIVYGLSIANVAEAAPGSNGTSPSTSQHFKKGVFGGLTFNISGFIQGLFSGGGSSKSSGH